MRSPLLCLLIAASLAPSGAALAQTPPPASDVPPAPPPPASLVEHDAAPPLAPVAPTDVIEAEPALAVANDHSALAADGFPMAGWHNGIFYLRDHNDNFRVHLQGRAQIDAYTYFGPGVAQSTLKDTLLLRRIRPELTGEFLKHWSWMIAGDWGSTSLDNPKGATELSASSAGAAPTATSAKFAPVEAPSVKAAPTDVFVNFQADTLFNVQVGQFDAPFSLENRTSDKYLPFMERSLAVRDLGIPTNKELGLMLWGENTKKFFHYALGGFLGDGQNRLNVDNSFDAMGRVFVHPLAGMEGVHGALKNLQLGGSFRYGSRDPGSVYYDYPGFTTQGNYSFWAPTYNGSKGLTHILPSGSQTGAAAELRIPVSRFDLTGELVYVSNGTREAVDGYQATNSERFGDLSGYAYYAQLAFWPCGQRDINGQPGYENITHVDFSKPDPVDPPHALQLLAKWEQLSVAYNSASRNAGGAGKPDAKNVDGNIKANAFSVGANYWYTKHLRLSVNYVLNLFDDSEPLKPTTATSPAQTSSQRALAPGQTLSPGQNDAARDGGHVLHELLFRVGVAL